MGLDTFAIYGKEHPKYSEDPETGNNIPNNLFAEVNGLCSGIFSSGDNSFRGKVYADAIEYFSGISLYQEIIGPEDVYHIADSLEDMTPGSFSKYCDETGNHYNLTYMDMYALKEWFLVVAKENGSLYGWW